MAIAVVIRSGAIANISERFRVWPVEVAGTLTSGSVPLQNVSVIFNISGMHAGVTRTDKYGRCTVGLDTTGDYTVIIGATDTLWSTYREVTIGADRNVVNIDLPPTEIDVEWAAREALKGSDVIQVAILGPTSPLKADTVSFIRWDERSATRFVGVGYGRYTIAAFTTADASDRVASLAAASVTLSDSRRTAKVRLDMVRRQLALEVREPNGALIDYASAEVLRERLERDAAGRFDLSAVPAGVPLVVRAAGWLPACVLVGREGRQVVSMRPRGRYTLMINLIGGPGRAVGDLSGSPGSECPVPIDGFETDVRRDAETMRVKVAGLPAGHYGYRADKLAPITEVTVPGPTVDYMVPVSCHFCGS
jgi:hypothetical protein